MSLWTPPRGSGQAAIDLLYPPVDPYANDPVAYSRDILGFHPWTKQAEILRSVHAHGRTAVRACHGVGKTAVAARVALWFLAVHGPDCRVVTTAPTWAQVEQLLWRQIRAAVATAHDAGKAASIPKPSATKLEIGDEWFAIGMSTNEPERFQGHHAQHLLLIVDEASGVAEKIYEAAEGFQTADGAKMLLIGNPTRIGGQFHRAFTTERGQWNPIHISVFDSPNYTGEQVPAHVARSLPRAAWAAEKEAQWGSTSPMYQVRVEGNFADSGENTVIALYLVENAQARTLAADSTQHQVVISGDIARYGDDETTIFERVDQRIRMVDHYIGKRPPSVTVKGSVDGDLVATAGRIADHARKHPVAHVRIVIDDTGVGGGVTDILRNQGWKVTAFNGAEQAHRPLEFPNRRSELWFEGAAQMEDLDLDPDEQLAADLTSPTYTYDLKGRRVVEAKDDTKKRLGRSPDRGDGALLTLVPERASRPVVVPQPAGERQDDGTEHRSIQDILTKPM